MSRSVARLDGVTAARPTPATAAPLDRSCACGRSAGASGYCGACQSERRFGATPFTSASVLGNTAAGERDAEHLAREALAASAPAPSSPLAQPLPGPGKALPDATRAFFEPRLGAPLDRVRVHDDARAGLMAAGLGAAAFSRGSEIWFGEGRFEPETARGRGLLAHELAHTVQPGAQHRIARKTLTDLPATTRKALKISRVPPDQGNVDGWIKTYFDPKSTTTRNSPTATEFGAEIADAALQKGLRNVALELESQSEPQVTPATSTTPETQTNTDPAKWPLPVGTILDLALDLRPQQGEHAIFRFTHYADSGTAKILIEKKHVLAPAPTATAPVPATVPPTTGSAAASFTGSVPVGKIKVEIDASFGNDNGKAIADAVGLLPEPIRQNADGLSFVKGASGGGGQDERGHYDPLKDSVTLFSEAFDASARRVGKETNPSYVIVHEIAHAVDLRPLFKAQRARDQLNEKRKTLDNELKHPKIDVNNSDPLAGIGDDPKRKAEETRLKGEIAKLDVDIATQEKAIGTAKSVAGSEVGDEKKLGSESLATDFGKALTADGVAPVNDALKRNRAVDAANKKAEAANAANPQGPQTPVQPQEKTLSTGITSYAATDLMEAFAENMSIYLLDEALLLAIRPKTHAFFAKAFPKTVKTP